MTNRVLWLLLCSVWGAMIPAVNAQRIKGSDTLLPLTQELSEAYLKKITHRVLW